MADEIDKFMSAYASLRQTIIDTYIPGEPPPQLPVRPYGARPSTVVVNGDPAWQDYLRTQREEHELNPQYGILRRRLELMKGGDNG